VINLYNDSCTQVQVSLYLSLERKFTLQQDLKNRK